MTPQIPALTLNDGHDIPALGFGTYPLKGDDGYRAIRAALDAGYRLVDSAVNYENEEEVGRAIRDFLKESGTPREDVTVQTKIPGRHHAYDLAVQAGRDSAAKMGLDQIDVLLIHWPNPSAGLYKEAWRGLVALREAGVARSIGVSNFTAAHLADVVDDSGVTPAVNQIELHPAFQQRALRAHQEQWGIRTESWGPLGQGKYELAELPGLADIAAAHGKSVQQVAIRWHLQEGLIVFPKTTKRERMIENADVFDFELSADEMATIAAADKGQRVGAHPDNTDF